MWSATPTHILDSNLFIDHVKSNDDGAKKILIQAGKGEIFASISAYTKFELWQGIANRDARRKYEWATSPCRVIIIDDQIATRAAELFHKYRGNGPSPGDVILAATAEKYDLIIYTRDNDFQLLAQDARITVRPY
ncbi:MAG: hypothetical protein CVU44_11095 [Chloroflexi bacterium HGW-Chloroflexi-6]|nr:MAG: hypothetical protein CVU44_11095 [Chloroflexi bacterium HGW-Chloroflexi-6]